MRRERAPPSSARPGNRRRLGPRAGPVEVRREARRSGHPDGSAAPGVRANGQERPSASGDRRVPRSPASERRTPLPRGGAPVSPTREARPWPQVPPTAPPPGSDSPLRTPDRIRRDPAVASLHARPPPLFPLPPAASPISRVPLHGLPPPSQSRRLPTPGVPRQPLLPGRERQSNLSARLRRPLHAHRRCGNRGHVPRPVAADSHLAVRPRGSVLPSCHSGTPRRDRARRGGRVGTVTGFPQCRSRRARLRARPVAGTVIPEPWGRGSVGFWGLRPARATFRRPSAPGRLPDRKSRPPPGAFGTRSPRPSARALEVEPHPVPSPCDRI